MRDYWRLVHRLWHDWHRCVRSGIVRRDRQLIKLTMSFERLPLIMESTGTAIRYTIWIEDHGIGVGFELF